MPSRTADKTPPASQSQHDEQEDDGQLVLLASLSDVSPFVALLKAIHGLSQVASLIFSDAGIQIQVEYKRALQATTYLSSKLFDEWHYAAPKEEEQEEASQTQTDDEADEAGQAKVIININLSILHEVLSIFGSGGGVWRGGKGRWKRDDDTEREEERPEVRGPLDGFFSRQRTTSMRMSYAGEGYPLRLLLAERAEGPTTVCHINTLVSEAGTDLHFDDAEKVVKIIMKSSWLKDALTEIDPSCDFVTISCNPPQKVVRGKGRVSDPTDSFFRIEAKSMRGSVEMDYPNDREVLELFECGQPIKFNYNYDIIHQAVRALSVSVKVSIRIDDDGLMSLQFLMPTGQGAKQGTYMEFILLAREDNL